MRKKKVNRRSSNCPSGHSKGKNDIKAFMDYLNQLKKKKKSAQKTKPTWDKLKKKGGRRLFGNIKGKSTSLFFFIYFRQKKIKCSQHGRRTHVIIVWVHPLDLRMSPGTKKEQPNYMYIV